MLPFESSAIEKMPLGNEILSFLIKPSIGMKISSSGFKKAFVGKTYI